MLKKGSIPQLTSLLFAAQGTHWSNQRKLAIISQLIMLLLGMILLSNIVITIGEKRLQNDWATQRYSELQTVGSLLSDKISFQEFRTRTFAGNDSLVDYLSHPQELTQQKLVSRWNNLTDNIPELIEIALFNPQGQLIFSSSHSQLFDALPQSFLDIKHQFKNDDIYTSEINFAPISGKLVPYIFQIATISSDKSQELGYLVTFSSINRVLQSVKPDVGANQSPLFILDTMGTLYADSGIKQSSMKVPNYGIGGNFSQNYPELWRKIAISKFGQFYGGQAIYVFLKVDLMAQSELERNYFLVSYVLDEHIQSKFTHWKYILIVASIILTLLGCAVILLLHLFGLEKRAKQYNVALVDKLFEGDVGYLIASDNGRIIASNSLATQALSSSKDELDERSLQHALQIEHLQYSNIIKQVQQHGCWSGELDLRSFGGKLLNASFRFAPKNTLLEDAERDYIFVSLTDVSQLAVSQHKTQQLALLANSSVAVALVNTQGQLINANKQFERTMHLNDNLNHNVRHLLGEEIDLQWALIQQQLILKGCWQGCIKNEDSRMSVLFNAHLNQDNDNDYITITVLPEHTSLKNRISKTIPHRSSILIKDKDLERYFNQLEKHKKLHSSMMIIDISPTGTFNHMSDMGKLEKRQQDIELRLLLELPKAFQLAQWQLGKLLIILPNTSSDEAHQFAIDLLAKLNDTGLAEGISIGLVAYHEGQSLHQFIENAEVALRRAKQNGEHKICQAFTRPNKVADLEYS
ncbi:MAG: PAS domain-containing protein [Parashewanella sp.]